MARFTTAGGEGSGAPGPQGPQGPAGQDANTGDFTFENSSAVAPGDISITSNTAPGTITLSAYAGVEVATHEDFGLTANKIVLTNNGSTNNITIGDDAIIGDGNVANHVVIIGQQDQTQAGVVLGSAETEFISTNGTDLSLTANNDIILNPGSNYAYIGTPQIDGSNRIAKMSDITGGSGSDTADFIFTNDEDNTGRSIISLPGDKGMMIAAGEDSDLYLTAGDDLYIQTLGQGDDIHIQAADDIRLSAGNENVEFGTVQSWTMNSEGEFHLPGSGYISNPANSSGDGFGNDTLELVPDEELSADQRIIIDPTSPNHIHIRAGGAQDESQAYLILGGERTHVQVSDQDGNVRISSKQPDITYSLQNVNPESSNLLIVDSEFEIDGNWFIQYNGTKYSLNGYYTQNGQTFMTQYDIPFETGGYYNFGYTRGENGWNFSSDGSLYGPGESSVVKVTGIENATDSNSLSVTSSGTMTVTAAGGDMNFYMDGGMYIGDSNSDNQIIKRSELNTLDAKTLPVGGTTAQVLSKVDGTDFNATWVDAAGAGLQTRVAGVSDAEIGYLANVTSDIQTQLNSKPDLLSPTITMASFASASETTDPVTISTANNHGGVGFAGLMKLENAGAGVTNPKKFIRMNSTGGLEVVNNNYSATIFHLADNGDLSAIGTVNGATIGDSGWQTISSFTNGYSGNSVAYRKINNVVYLRGNISGGTSGSVAFTLPSGFRPSTIEHVVLVQKYGTMTGSYITVQTDGQVIPQEDAAWLSGVVYPV